MREFASLTNFTQYCSIIPNNMRNNEKKELSYTDLDDRDRKIIDFLREDGRIAFREIARNLDIAEGTVRKRANKLLQSGLINIRAVGDPLKLGVPVLATTTLKVKSGHVDEVSDQLAELDNVRYVACGVGNKEVLIESLHESVDGLYEFTTEVIGNISSVITTDTFQVVRVKKSVWDWPIPIREEDLSHD